MSKLHQLKCYISYWLNQENEHSLHSPFVYDLYKNVISNKRSRKQFYNEIEKVRSQFLLSDKQIEILQLGSESDLKTSGKISSIANHGITNLKYSQLLDRLIDYLGANTIIELGTSLGINTLYLASDKNRKVITFEGNPSLAAISQAVFEGNNRPNISVIEGNIDDTLSQFLKSNEKIDLIFFDANHTYNATKSYFEQVLNKSHDKTCLVFDDIHRDPGMEKIWEEINSYYETTVTIDLFQMGIAFLDPELKKQHYILSY